MGYIWILFTIHILQLILTGWAKPIIIPEDPEVVVLKGNRLQLTCRDEGFEVKWQREKGRRTEGVTEEGGAAVITLGSAQDHHMGRYTCRNTETQEASSIYVYVKDYANAFARSMVNDLLVREGDSCTVPCLATDPAVTDLRLHSCDGPPLPLGTYTVKPQRGIVINKIRREQEGCYVCVGRLGELVVRSSQYNVEVRLVPQRPPNISLSRTENAILTEGQSFELVCNADNVNYDLSVKWICPDATTAVETRTSHIQRGSRGYQRSATLKIASAAARDSGAYRCEAQNEKGVNSASIHLDVYVRGFINLTESPVNELHVREGASLTLRAELEAYPTPNILAWAHQGQVLHNTSEHVITIQKRQYRYTSELRLVRVHGYEGGIYTFLASHNDDSANRSFSVHVTCKPMIVSQEGPVDGKVRCVASGYPAPKISWYYCESPHTRCSLLANATEEEDDVAMVTVSGTGYGRSLVESRLNVSQGPHRSLECVASAKGGEQAYALFSLSENTVPHRLFTPLLTGVVCAAVGLSLILVVLLYKYLQKPKYQIHWKVIESIHGNNYIYIDPTQLPYDQKWEFPRERLRFGKVLGSGAFGKVVQATAYGLRSPDSVTTVAVKMLKPSAHSTEKEALMSELKVLSYLGNHVNIVNLLGACTQGGPTLVITEYCCYGDLLSFLRRKKEEFFSLKTGDGYYKNLLSRPQPMRDGNGNGYMPMRTHQRKPNLSECCGDKEDLSLDTEDLLSFSYQVAKGMDFLTCKNCIHRDLAARNILLTKGRVAKICDFGLARDIASDSNYVLRGNARLPVKWMSPESLFEGIYTFESDVWSYGILLWEIFSLGTSPYPGIHVGAGFYKLIQDGYRMNEPEFAPSEIYEVMRCCWNMDPLKRPPTKKLVEKTESLLSEHTRHEYLNLMRSSSGTRGVAPQGIQQGEPTPRLSSVSSTTAPTMPLLSSSDVFLEYETV
ncbi:KIT proto-oncogene, receptor tyrosine kinase b [Engraulis encrasicolus]|uniref:KIT proto-oncogene, receptor tyrosine kinase b n=1 Tax=Engraulis encrasicolus TaxID=184585 RepID=UPI002FD06CA3